MKRAYLLLLALGLSGCGDTPAQPVEMVGPTKAYIAGQIEGSGAPPALALVGWEVWPAPDSGVPNFYGYAWTDSVGTFESFIGWFDRAQLDSITITAHGGPCQPYEDSSLTWRQLPLAAGQSDTVVNTSLEVSVSHPPARLALDSSCAGGAYKLNGYPDPFGETLGLWIDDISDSIRGRWRLNYQVSVADGYGHFSGAQVSDSLTLDLRQDVPWGTCTGYTLKAEVGAGDTLGVARLSSTGCPVDPVGFRLVQSAGLRWPFENP